MKLTRIEVEVVGGGWVGDGGNGENGENGSRSGEKVNGVRNGASNGVSNGVNNGGIHGNGVSKEHENAENNNGG
jgi:hypothetical protein